ncbi:MAG: phage baseplate assembly protein V [Nitrosomonadaceae bacterium]
MQDNENEHIRYDDKYAGLVVDIKDPLFAGRIKVIVPALSEDFTTDWALPCQDSAGPGSGWFDPPPVNATVWIVFQEGDPEHARYVGGSWSVPNGVSEVPTEFQREDPNNRGYKSPGGHLLEFDDDAATQGIRLTTLGGAIISLDDANEILSITAPGDALLNITKNLDINVAEDANITATKNMTLTAGEDLTLDVTGNTILNGSDLNLNVDNFNVSAAQMVDIMATSMATFKGTAGTTIGSPSSTTMVNGILVTIAGGGAPVAVVGGQTLAIGNLGAPIVGTIVQGSSKVSAAP